MDLLTIFHSRVRDPHPVKQAWYGAACLVRAALFTVRCPPLLSLAAAPVVLGLLLYPGCAWAAWRLTNGFHGWAFSWAEPQGWLLVLWWLAFAISWLLTALVSFLVMLAAASGLVALLTAPILDELSARAEERFKGPGGPPPLPLWKSVWRTLVAMGVGGALYLTAMALVSLIYLVPVAGVVVGPVLHALVTVAFLALQFVEWPAERHHQGIWQRLDLLRRHWAAATGFGAACWLMLVFPLTLPLCVVGGTLFFHALYGEGAASAAGGAGAGSSVSGAGASVG